MATKHSPQPNADLPLDERAAIILPILADTTTGLGVPRLIARHIDEAMRAERNTSTVARSGVNQGTRRRLNENRSWPQPGADVAPRADAGVVTTPSAKAICSIFFKPVLKMSIIQAGFGELKGKIHESHAWNVSQCVPRILLKHLYPTADSGHFRCCGDPTA